MSMIINIACLDYRKNEVHFKDYCHPGDESYDNINSDDSVDESALNR